MAAEEVTTIDERTAKSRMQDLWWAYETGESSAEHLKQMAYWSEKAAEQGHAEGEYRWGLCCREGLGVKEDPEQAFLMFQAAAQHVTVDSVRAAFELARCYAEGYGVCADLQKAEELLYGWGGETCFHLAMSCKQKQDSEKALLWMKLAAKRDFGEACMELGKWFFTGEVGLEKNISGFRYWFERGIEQEEWVSPLLRDETDVYWYTQAAEAGAKLAQVRLTQHLWWIYEQRGERSAEHLETMAYWSEKLAEQGLIEGKYRFGRCCREGLGVKEDPEKAFQLFQVAVDLGNFRAIHSSGSKWERRDLEWWDESRLELARCYAEGYGVSADPKQAKELLRKVGGK